MDKKLLFAIFCAPLVFGQTVTPSPASVTFSYQVGAAKLPAAQSVSVRVSSGTPAFTTSITGSNSLWLTVTPDSGTLPGSVSIDVNPTSLPVGIYTAGVDITVAGVANPVAIPVTLSVTAAPSTLTVLPTSLTFSAPPIPVASQTIQLSTLGSPISFTAASGSAWLQVSPNVGVVVPGEGVTLTVTVDPSSLNPQAAAYAGKLTLTLAGTGSAAKPQSIPVALTVNNVTPSISTIWPSTLPLNGPAQTITIRGTSFYNLTTVQIQGVNTPLTTTVLSGSALLAVVPASQLTTSTTLQVIVVNPTPGGPSAPAPVVVGNIPTIAAVGNVASYGSASISPGELVTIFGSNIGPTIPAAMAISSGFVTTTIGGVTVTIDGQPAPLLYVSQNQVTAQVPYEATQGTSKILAIVNGTIGTASAQVTITPTAPGLFTSDGSGTGQAAALNFNTTSGYTLNTQSNPVHVGDMVILYLTGEGDYNPTISPRTGLIVPSGLNPLPQLSPLPTVTIGGATATVNYAGPLIGSILGLLQINAVVPSGGTTGQAVPATVNIGGTTSPTVTLSVHP